MHRVVVVGAPGAGKTTVAAALSGITGIPVIELDALWWEPGWVEAGGERLRGRLEPLLEADRWIVDGNYFNAGLRESAWILADTVVWLDLGRPITVARVVRRTFRRAMRRTELWPGCRESLRTALRRDSIIAFAWRSHRKYIDRYEQLERDPSFAHLRWVRLRTPREVKRWLRSLSSHR